MAERISGLSIGLTMDDSEIRRSVSSIKESFREVRSSARVSMNNIKFNDKNIKSYKNNIQELSKTFDQQQKNVSALKSRYDELEQSGKGNTQEARRLRTEFNKQVDELNRLGGALDDAKYGLHDLKRENSVFTKMGNTISGASENLRTFGGHMQNIGGALTKNITLPALGVTTAVGGIVAAFGWGRLVGLDSAQAQLKGLGYSTEDVGRISDQVTTAIEGGMTTMAEGTSVAAGAMAAGVKEGAELERYIKLVGDAAVGANRPVGDMAQIFNRVQGSGKLMTMELNMIEQGMPGFAQAMADNLGVTQEEFRKMVTAGEVGSTEFMDVMDEFAGGMAGAYAESWQGMVANTKAYIGILGQNLLGGVFENSKLAIADFIKIISSEEIQNRAQEIGVTIGDTFSKVIESVKGAIEWFGKFDEDQLKLIGKFALVAVAAGPVIGIFGKIISTIGVIGTVIGPVIGAISGLTAGISTMLSPLGSMAIAFPKLSAAIGFLTGPIGLTLMGLTALGTGMVVAYQRSEPFRKFIQDLKERFLEFIPILVDFGKGIYDSFMGLVVPAVQAVGGFFQEMFSKIKTFWQSDGQQTIQAFMNAINIIKSVVSFAMPYIQTTITVAFKVVLAVIKMVWENIKGVISGSLNIITGLVRVFSGIFTGDFSKMWEGVKNIFSGAIQVVWNGFQLLFYGRIIKGVGSLVKLFAGSIRSLWTNVVSFFKSMFSGATTQATNLFSKVISIGRNLNSGFNNIVRRMVQSVINFFKNMHTNVTTTVGNIRSGVQNVFSAMRDFVVNSVVRLKDGAMNGFNSLKDGAGNLMTRMKDNVSKQFTAMVDGAKQLPGKLGSAISNGASKAVDGIKTLGNKMTGKLGSVVNGVIGGLNSITSKIGITGTIDKWNVPTFSTGTGQGSPSGKLTKNGKIAMDTLATVGDKGNGNGSGTRELVHYPNGKVGLYDNDATIFAPKGTTIFSNQETESLLGQIPRFSEGTGLLGGIKALAGKAIDYITNPKKIFDDLINIVGDSFSGISGFMLDMAKGSWNMIKDGMFNWMKGKFSEASVGKSQKWMDYKMTTPYSPNAPVPGYPRSFNDGHHYGIDYGTPTGVNITAPMAGTVTSMSDRGGGNVARLKAGGNAAQYFMHMSSVKTGKVGIGESVGKSGNTGEWTTGPHVHWQHEDPSASYVQNRNTKNPLSMIKGHLKGGQILSDGLFNLHKGEYVINPNEPTKAMKLLAIVGKKLAGKSKQTSQLPNNVPTGNNNDRIVEVLLEQNKILMESNNKMNKAINVLLGIEDKTGFEPGKAKRAIDKHVDRRNIMI